MIMGFVLTLTFIWHKVYRLFMKAIKAITLSLGEIDKPVITKYQLGLTIHELYKHKTYDGESVNLKKERAESSDLTNYLKPLLEEGILAPHKNLANTYTLLGRSKAEPDDVVCAVDPFCYISHLSAMSYHGITDRIPTKLFISSPSNKEWQAFSRERMRRDLKDDYDAYCENEMPKLIRTKIKKIGKTEVHCLSSKHLGAYKNVRDRPIRVSSLGRTFLEMLKNPELCGGINHVIDVYREDSKKYLKLITDEIDNNGRPIDKVRAGYVLNEVLGINDNEVINGWMKYVQRGGSRKLDPSSEYISKWSETWCISLNVFEKSK